MVNGIGVRRLGRGWHRGRGRDARPAGLDAHPARGRFKLSGDLPEGSTATDLVLTITEMLRKHGVVGKFVEFYGKGCLRAAAGQPRHDRQHEPGVRLDHRGLPDRRGDLVPRAHRPPGEQLALVEAYAKAQGLWHDPTPSRATPRAGARPRHRRPVDRRPEAPAGPHRGHRGRWGRRSAPRSPRRSGEGGLGDDRSPRLPGLRPGDLPATATAEQPRLAAASADAAAPGRRAPDGTTFTLDHGAVTIAAITSCTNTSNPSVMLGAALLAKKAVEKGLQRKAVGQDDAGARFEGRHRLLRGRPHAVPRQALGFNLVGYGCTTCIGNSGPALPEVSAAVNEGPRRRLGAVGQPQLRGPDQPGREDELPGVPAAGRRLRDRRLDGPRPVQRPARLGDTEGNDVFLRTSGPRRRRSGR